MALCTILEDLSRGVGPGTWRLCLRELQLKACRVHLVPEIGTETYALYVEARNPYGTIRLDGDGLWRLHR